MKISLHFELCLPNALLLQYVSQQAKHCMSSAFGLLDLCQMGLEIVRTHKHQRAHGVLVWTCCSCALAEGGGTRARSTLDNRTAASSRISLRQPLHPRVVREKFLRQSLLFFAWVASSGSGFYSANTRTTFAHRQQPGFTRHTFIFTAILWKRRRIGIVRYLCWCLLGNSTHCLTVTSQNVTIKIIF